ncbi:MAG: hypothetical protein PVJ39_04455 [Gammaproteobacteria bacterium]|jgi:hypothetical protein
MEYRNFSGNNGEIDVIVIDTKDGALRAKTRNIDLDKLVIKNRAYALKKNSALELAVAVKGATSNVTHIVSGFLMRKGDGSIAIVFSEYNNDFSKTIRKRLRLPRASLIAYTK